MKSLKELDYHYQDSNKENSKQANINNNGHQTFHPTVRIGEDYINEKPNPFYGSNGNMRNLDLQGRGNLGNANSDSNLNKKNTNLQSISEMVYIDDDEENEKAKSRERYKESINNYNYNNSNNFNNTGMDNMNMGNIVTMGNIEIGNNYDNTGNSNVNYFNANNLNPTDNNHSFYNYNNNNNYNHNNSENANSSNKLSNLAKRGVNLINDTNTRPSNFHPSNTYDTHNNTVNNPSLILDSNNINLPSPTYNDDDKVGTNELYNKLNDIINLNSKKRPENTMSAIRKGFEIDMNQ